MNPGDRLARIAVQHVPKPGAPQLTMTLVSTLLSTGPGTVIVRQQTEFVEVIDFYPRAAAVSAAQP